MQITRKGYYTIERDGIPLTRDDGQIRQVTSRDECYEYITEDGRGGVFTIKCPDREVELPLVNIPGIFPSAGRPHPQYPSFDMDDMPGSGGAVASGRYSPATEPTTTRSVSVSSRADLLTELGTDASEITVQAAAGAMAGISISSSIDCHLIFEDGASFTSGITISGTTARLRIDGGEFTQFDIAEPVTDIILDGVTIVASTTALVLTAANGTTPTTEYGSDSIQRIVMVNSVCKITGDGTTGYFAICQFCHDVFFANNNILCGDVSGNGWGFRLQGCENWVITDNTIQNFQHHCLRMNDYDCDYVYIKGGVWLHGDTSGGSWKLLWDATDTETCDNIYIHDTTFYTTETSALDFGMGGQAESRQVGKSWEALRIDWNATSSSVISDTRLDTLEGLVNGDADYGSGTHTYTYDAGLTLPTNLWRTIPGLAEDNPNNL